MGTARNTITGRDERRSTRISETVRVSVSGESKLGSVFSESTLTLAVNCHGCIYPSRNEHRTGSWVTLEFPNQASNPKTHPVRAQVKFVRAPRNQNDHYEIGVELESPANVWPILQVPKDWLRFPALPSKARETTLSSSAPVSGELSTAAAEGGVQPDSQKSAQAASAPDKLLRAIEKNLRQAAETAVTSAVNSQLNPAVNQAIMAIDKLSQVTMRQIDEYCARSKEKLIASALDGLRHELQTDLTNSKQLLQKQVEVSLSEIQEAGQDVIKTASSEGHLVLAESVDFLKQTSREIQEQCAAQLHETTDRASAELSAETVRFSDRQFALLTKQAQSAISESSTLLEARAAEARSQFETEANLMVGHFQQKASAEIEHAAIHVRQTFAASLTSLAEEARAEWEAKQRAWQDDFARSGEQQCDEFRLRLDAILQSSMVTAIASINEHSTALLKSFSKIPKEQYSNEESTHEVGRNGS